MPSPIACTWSISFELTLNSKRNGARWRKWTLALPSSDCVLLRASDWYLRQQFDLDDANRVGARVKRSDHLYILILVLLQIVLAMQFVGRVR